MTSVTCFPCNEAAGTSLWPNPMPIHEYLNTASSTPSPCPPLPTYLCVLLGLWGLWTGSAHQAGPPSQSPSSHSTSTTWWLLTKAGRVCVASFHFPVSPFYLLRLHSVPLILSITAVASLPFSACFKFCPFQLILQWASPLSSPNINLSPSNPSLLGLSVSHSPLSKDEIRNPWHRKVLVSVVSIFFPKPLSDLGHTLLFLRFLSLSLASSGFHGYFHCSVFPSLPPDPSESSFHFFGEASWGCCSRFKQFPVHSCQRTKSNPIFAPLFVLPLSL